MTILLQQKTGILQFMKERNFIYRFLAKSLFLSPTQEIFKFYMENRHLVLSILPETDNGLKFLEQGLLEMAQYRAEKWQALEKEHERLFFNSGPVPVYPWESVYTGDHILYDAHTLAVKSEYRKWQLDMEDPTQGPPDHIGLECSFMAVLTERAMKDLAEDKEDGFVENIKAQQHFLQAHIAGFAGLFCEKLRKAAACDFYRGLGFFLEFWIKSDLQNLTELLALLLKDKSREIKFPLRKQVLPESFLAADTFYIGLKHSAETGKQMKIVPTAGRNNCGGCCVVKAHVQDGNILKVTTDSEPDAPESPQVRACVRAYGYRRTFLSPDRLKYPMKRVGERGEGKFVRISWDEALDLLALETKRIKKCYGAASRYVNYAWGYSGAVQSMRLAKRLLALDGGYLDFYNSYSSACTSYATPYTYGTKFTGNTPDDYVHSKLIILWGHNPAETIFGTNTTYYLKKAKESGTKIIVVDPRYSMTAAALADEWIPVRPTTDNALMDAMAYTIFTENLHDQKFLDTFCLGFDASHMPVGIDGKESYCAYLLGEKDGIAKTPAWAAKITGVPEIKIQQMARDYALMKPAALIQGYGPQRHAYGEQPVRGGTVLAAMTGNVGIAGGCASGAGATDRHGVWSVPTGENPFPGRIPCYLWTEAMAAGEKMSVAEHGLEGVAKLDSGIKMLWNMSGQCLLNQHGDINKTMEILKDTTKCEFIVCSDIFMTPSAKFADLLLPGTTVFEEDNMRSPWGSGDYICSMSQVIEPPFACRPEYEWMKDVAERLGIREAFTEGHESMADWCAALYHKMQQAHPELPAYEKFRQRGIFKWAHTEPQIAFAAQIADFAKNPFPTPSGKIEIFSPRLYALNKPEEIPAVPKYIRAWEGPEDALREKYPLQMIGWHYARRCHSVHDNNETMEEAFRQEMWMNPQDAAARNIVNGDRAEVFNDRGKMQIFVKVTPRIMPGVISVPQGAWFSPDGKGIDQRGSINVLTSLKATPLAKGNAQHTNLVDVKKIQCEEGGA